MDYFIGVDVGTSSVRSVVVDINGTILASSTFSIEIWNPRPDFYQQSSENIWKAVCESVKRSIHLASIPKENIKAIGFDATCSMVVLDASYQPVSISPSGEPFQNIIMWMDHRAHEQSQFINNTQDDVLKCLGGKISVEMQVPKVLWLKQNSRNWSSMAHFLDLPDFLTFRACHGISSTYLNSTITRSMCSTTCKWTFIPTSGYSCSFFSRIGLDEFISDFVPLGGVNPVIPGNSIGTVSREAANQLGLCEGTVVSASLIDAYAGLVGTLGLHGKEDRELMNKVSITAGTSTCLLFLNDKEVFKRGIWGPYRSVLVEDTWVLEAGQSVAGKLIDYMIESHEAYPEAKKECENRFTHYHLTVFTGRSITIYQLLNERIEKIAKDQNVSYSELVRDLHVLPDFHGNRSPLADPNAKGAILGLTLVKGIDALSRIYLATIVGLAVKPFPDKNLIFKCSCRHILETLEYGHDSVVMCGGLSLNDLYVHVHADVLGRRVLIPQYIELSVPHGSALTASSAYLKRPLLERMRLMSKHGRVISADTALKPFYDDKYRMYLKMQELVNGRK